MSAGAISNLASSSDFLNKNGGPEGPPVTISYEKAPPYFLTSLPTNLDGILFASEDL